MTAHIQIKKGIMYVVLTYYTTEGRKRKWISTGLKEKGNKMLVKKELDKYIDEYSYLETGQDPSEVIYSEYLTSWHEKRKDQIELSSWQAYSAVIDTHIKPYFEERKFTFNDMTPKNISEFYEYLSKHGNKRTGEGLATATIKKIASVVKLSLADARVNGLIELNPAVDLKVPRVKGQKQVKKVYMTKEEAQKVLDAFKDDPIQPIVYMALFYGLRKSEVLGLKWENVDFEENTFEIKSTLVKNITIIESDKPKTEESNAVFQMLPQVRKILLGRKAEQDEYRQIYGNTYKEKGYVFCHPDGRYYRPDGFTRSFQRKLKNAGLPPMRFHDLRHSAASVLFDLGWDIEKIKNWLRHRDIETTSNIYTHISKERKKLMAEELEDLYKL